MPHMTQDIKLTMRADYQRSPSIEKGFQGVRYVTGEEAPRFARAFEADPEPSPPIWPPDMSWRQLVIEGVPRRWLANRYERSRRGRRLCLAYYGTACSCCRVSLGARYGTAAEGVIEVHHLVPLEAIGQAYVLDPIADLQPVCPNCHTIIHRRQPPYSLDEVRQMLTDAADERH
jgi:hypothetical protein